MRRRVAFVGILFEVQGVSARLSDVVLRAVGIRGAMIGAAGREEDAQDMQKTTTADFTLLAAWIGFGGALVGGVVAGLASWLTARVQWTREREDRRLERLEQSIVELQKSCGRLVKSSNMGRPLDEGLVNEAFWQASTTSALAKPVSPALNLTLDELLVRIGQHMQKWDEHGLRLDLNFALSACVLWLTHDKIRESMTVHSLEEAMDRAAGRQSSSAEES